MFCYGVYIIYSQDDIRCVKKDTEKIGTEKRELTTKIHELELVIDNSEKDQKKLRLKKQVNILSVLLNLIFLKIITLSESS